MFPLQRTREDIFRWGRNQQRAHGFTFRCVRTPVFSHLVISSDVTYIPITCREERVKKDEGDKVERMNYIKSTARRAIYERSKFGITKSSLAATEERYI